MVFQQVNEFSQAPVKGHLPVSEQIKIGIITVCIQHNNLTDFNHDMIG
jgi:hypothetical protein